MLPRLSWMAFIRSCSTCAAKFGPESSESGASSTDVGLMSSKVDVDHVGPMSTVFVADSNHFDTTSSDFGGVLHGPDSTKMRKISAELSRTRSAKVARTRTELARSSPESLTGGSDQEDGGRGRVVNKRASRSELAFLCAPLDDPHRRPCL